MLGQAQSSHMRCSNFHTSPQCQMTIYTVPTITYIDVAIDPSRLPTKDMFINIHKFIIASLHWNSGNSEYYQQLNCQVRFCVTAWICVINAFVLPLLDCPVCQFVLIYQSLVHQMSIDILQLIHIVVITSGMQDIVVNACKHWLHIDIQMEVF